MGHSDGRLEDNSAVCYSLPDKDLAKVFSQLAGSLFMLLIIFNFDLICI